ncbi:MAG TPA: putative peptidoglycan glycosyltransferase FtsW [Verrucomicrobiae bacterium]
MAILIGLGMVTLYSSSMNMDVALKKQKPGPVLEAPNPVVDVDKPAIGAHYLALQFRWFLVALAGMMAAACIDYRSLKKLSPWLLGFSAVLLVLVFAPVVGHAAKGAHRWIGRPHGAALFQPSELAKLALIIFLAAYADRFQRQMGGFVKGLVIPGFIMACVLGLIFIEPDRGCTILLASVCGVMWIIGGARLIYLAGSAAVMAAGLVVSILHDPMRMGRVMAWLYPEQSKDGAGYQVREAMIALGSGGWFGLGLGNGRQKLGFVPEHHTDFIFSIIGEELGLIATLAVVLLFVVLVICGIFISRRSCDTFGLLLGAGLTFMIGFQAFINIGVVTGLLPNKGMPLPFISYGGSNLVLMLVSVGLLISIARFATEEVRQKSSNPFEVALEPSHA